MITPSRVGEDLSDDDKNLFSLILHKKKKKKSM